MKCGPLKGRKLLIDALHLSESLIITIYHGVKEKILPLLHVFIVFIENTDNCIFYCHNPALVCLIRAHESLELV